MFSCCRSLWLFSRSHRTTIVSERCLSRRQSALILTPTPTPTLPTATWCTNESHTPWSELQEPMFSSSFINGIICKDLANLGIWFCWGQVYFKIIQRTLRTTSFVMSFSISRCVSYIWSTAFILFVNVGTPILTILSPDLATSFMSEYICV